MKLSTEQARAFDAIMQAVRSGRSFALAGYAGTGKTTVLARVFSELPRDGEGEPRACAFTGKAASVLRRKGIEGASTIHSAIYAASIVNYCKMCGEDRQKDCACACPLCGNRVRVCEHPLTDARRATVFRRKDADELQAEFSCFLVDEASMVGTDIYRDIRSVGRPIIAVGDPEQLEPVGQDSTSLVTAPDFTLTEIHRQAADNPIIRLSMDIRTGRASSAKRVQILPDGCGYRLTAYSGSVVPQTYIGSDSFICYTNRTRHAVNRQARRHLGLSGFMCSGERLIFLQNDRDLGVFNGMAGILRRELTIEEYADLVVGDTSKVARHATEGRCFLGLVELDGDETKPLAILRKGFGYTLTQEERQDTLAYRGVAALADYGYCVTCHKSQGSQWDSVTVIAEPALGHMDPRELRRWIYTATTRAAKQLVVLDGVRFFG